MRYFVLASFMLLFMNCKAQEQTSKNNTSNSIHNTNSNPKLVVGIVVDQMRFDFLSRFMDRYSENGFKRMIREGYNCKNHHFNYIPTKTGPGHATIFSGTTPKYHGVIGNDWYDRNLKRKVNCVEDNNVTPLGTQSKDGKKSPKWMKTTTFADENRLFTQMKGKTIGISIKHRGAILPAGHSANAAYWFDYNNNGNGNWISSTFYMNALPKWVTEFNDSKITESYFKVWNPLYDINSYNASGPDLNNYERIFKGKSDATFPYDLDALKAQNSNFKIIAETPFGNSLTTDFALRALDAEGLGLDAYTDVLTISYSSTDKVGHDFGPNSIELEDTYLRLDMELARLFDALDAQVGVGEYTVFLTGDHAAPNVPSFLASKRIPSGLFDLNTLHSELNTYIEENFGVSNIVLSRINNQLFLDREKLFANDIDIQALKKKVANQVLKYDLIDKVYITSEINHFDGSQGFVETMLANGHNQKRSGDIVFVFDPAVFKDTPWNRKGTDHHSGYSYDTHVPMLFFGKGISQGSTLSRTQATDIAPTITALLGTSFPNGNIGEPLEFVIKN